MVVPLLRKITAWSYSRYKDWKKCPLSAKYKFVDKIEVESTAVQTAGTSIHQLACEWASKKTSTGTPSKMRRIPKELAAFEEEFDELRNSKLQVVAEWDCDPWKQTREFSKFAWGFTKDWTLCEFFDTPRVWCRVKLDTHTFNHESKTVRVIDYKSGRIYPDDHEEQSELYAIGAFLKYPNAEKARVELWYLDQQSVTPYEYTRDQLLRLEIKWSAKVKPMLADTRFQPRPGKHCSWCPFGVSKGGVCKHG